MIRLMSENDIDRVYEIAVASFTDPWTKQMIKASVDSEYDYCIVYESDGNIAGFAVLSKRIDTADILDIAVDNAYRRQGIGGRLLDELINHGTECDINEYALEVRASNEPAKKMYAGRGFVKEAVRKNYYRNPIEDADIMWKRLYKG